MELQWARKKAGFSENEAQRGGGKGGGKKDSRKVLRGRHRVVKGREEGPQTRCLKTGIKG